MSFVRQPNSPECSQIIRMHQNVSLGSNGVHWVYSLWLSFVRQPSGPECIQIVQNASKHQFTVQWGGSDEFVAKNSDATSWHKLLHYLGPYCTVFRKATKRSRMHPNSTKRTKTSVYGVMGWIGCVHCEKFRRDFVALTFALVRPILHRVS